MSKVLVMHANLFRNGRRNGGKQVSLFCAGFHVCTATSSTSTPDDPGRTGDFPWIHRATLVRALRVLRGCGALLQLTKNRLRIGDLALLQK